MRNFMVTSNIQALWNPSATPSPKTIDFLVPTFKWGTKIANFTYLSKPPGTASYLVRLGKVFGELEPIVKISDREQYPKVKLRRKKLAIFVSGGGSNFRSIYEAALSGSVHGDVVVLVTNKSVCGGAEYAREKGIPVIVFPKAKDLQEGLSAGDLVTALRSYNVDFIFLAGYLKLIPVEVIRAYSKSILNIHPSLLPAFGGKGYHGMNVHKAVISSGARYSGPTVHFVDEHYDTGRILAQKVVDVLADDTAEELAARVLLEEHKLYVEAASALCDERVSWREDGVPVIRSKDNPHEFRVHRHSDGERCC